VIVVAFLRLRIAELDRRLARIYRSTQMGDIQAKYFTHSDLDKCRDFLRENGLDLVDKVWRGTGGLVGAIYFESTPDGGEWTAAFWKERTND